MVCHSGQQEYLTKQDWNSQCTHAVQLDTAVATAAGQKQGGGHIVGLSSGYCSGMLQSFEAT